MTLIGKGSRGNPTWTPDPKPHSGLAGLSARGLLHRELGLKAGKVAIDRSNREHAALAPVFQQTVPARNIAFDGNLVPLLGVADIVDRHIVVLAPEKRCRVEGLALSQHVARGGLALAFGHHPMLDPDALPGMWIGPTRDIARGIDSRDAGFEERVHSNAAVDLEPCLFRQAEARTHADADDHDIGL